MRRFIIITGVLAALVALLAMPGSALARDGTSCSYAKTDDDASSTARETPVDPDGSGTLVVYAGQEGTTDNDDVTVVGACLNTNTTGTNDFEGGTLEAGVGEDPATGTNDPADPVDAYVVADGDDDNVDPGAMGPGDSLSDGYIGLSNWESSDASKDNDCTYSATSNGPDDGTGSNSGGCIAVKPQDPDGTPGTGDETPGVGVSTEAAPVPTPMCGNDTGNQWEAGSDRDGCAIPD